MSFLTCLFFFLVIGNLLLTKRKFLVKLINQPKKYLQVYYAENVAFKLQLELLLLQGIARCLLGLLRVIELDFRELDVTQFLAESFTPNFIFVSPQKFFQLRVKDLEVSWSCLFLITQHSNSAYNCALKILVLTQPVEINLKLWQNPRLN